MVEKILLHIGDRKTATTSIQQALARGACRSEARLVYPVRPDRPHHHYLVGDFERPGGADGKAFRELAATLRAAEADIAVISSERFDRVDPAVLRAALERHMPRLAGRVHVLAYVRPHAERTLSSYAQVVKLGQFAGTLRAFHARAAKDRRYLYAPRFARWRATFGARFTLVPMLRDRLAGGDVIRDFFHRALDGAAFELASFPRANESVSLADLALMRRVHARLRRDRPEIAGLPRKQFGRYMAGLLAAAPEPGGTRPALDRALAEEIAATYAADADALDAAFFEAAPMAGALARAPERAVAAPQSFEAEDHFDARSLRAHDLWTDMAGEMIARDPQGWGHHAMGLFNAAMRGEDPQVSST